MVPCSQVKSDMFSMTPATPEMALAGHVGGPGGHLLGGQGRGGDDEDLGARQHPGQAHLDVAGARGHVDEEVVDRTPADVLEELLDGPVQDEAAPHDGGVLVGQEPHGDDLQKAPADGELEGDDLLGLGPQLALHAEQPGHREAPDVGVEEADGEAPAGQGHGQVDGDRGLAHPTLARGDGQDPGGGRDVDVESARSSWALQPGPVHEGGALGRRPSPRGRPGPTVTPGRLATRRLDVRAELGPQRDSRRW